MSKRKSGELIPSLSDLQQALTEMSMVMAPIEAKQARARAVQKFARDFPLRGSPKIGSARTMRRPMMSPVMRKTLSAPGVAYRKSPKRKSQSQKRRSSTPPRPSQKRFRPKPSSPSPMNWTAS